MPKGIILLGPSGSGKTTLGKLVAGRLGVAFLNIIPDPPGTFL